MEAAEAAPARMAIRYVRNSNTAHPTGDPSFAVQQCIPGVVPEAEADPFLMCDEFGPTPSKGAYPDDSDAGFDVPWHPHHGMDILSYMVEGCGRHADSMGNRETFKSPGFQWMSGAQQPRRLFIRFWTVVQQTWRAVIHFHSHITVILIIIKLTQPKSRSSTALKHPSLSNRHVVIRYLVLEQYQTWRENSKKNPNQIQSISHEIPNTTPGNTKSNPINTKRNTNP